jgi:preprotein translocase subunit Sec61beta
VCEKLLKEYFEGKEPNKGISPDEAVAYGAAVQVRTVQCCVAGIVACVAGRVAFGPCVQTLLISTLRARR